MKISTSTTSKATILTVDDNPENINVLSLTLRHFGYKVQAATNGEAAIKVAQTTSPDLIMLDINMPGIDGFETCRRLKLDERTRDIPVIFISALEEVEDKVQAFKVGGVDYLTKPYSVEEMLVRVETHLSIRRLQSDLVAANRELAARLEEISIARSAEREQRILAETLRDTIATINSSLDFDEVLDLILVNLERVVPHQTANIALLDDQKNIRIRRARGYQERGLKTTLLSMHLPKAVHTSWLKIADSRRTLIISDTNKDPDWVRLPNLEWIRSYACTPIILNDEIIGLLNLESDKPGAFKQFHADQLKAFADQAAVAIERVRLFNETQRMAITDGLTGVFNRRHLLQQVEHEYNRAQRYHHSLSAIMIDVDHFKLVNDTYGHPVGDKVLQDLAHLLRKNLRNVDLLGRYGGEEFLILLPETGYKHALEVAERIRRHVEETDLGTDETKLRVTISLGVAALEAGSDLALKTLVKNTDDALYAAKAAGRNRVSGHYPKKAG